VLAGCPFPLGCDLTPPILWSYFVTAVKRWSPAALRHMMASTVSGASTPRCSPTVAEASSTCAVQEHQYAWNKYCGQPCKVFLSHAGQQKDFARKLLKTLQVGYKLGEQTVFLDLFSILPAAKAWTSILCAVDESHLRAPRDNPRTSFLHLLTLFSEPFGSWPRLHECLLGVNWGIT
jgi:hypothetical protein